MRILNGAIVTIFDLRLSCLRCFDEINLSTMININENLVGGWSWGIHRSESTRSDIVYRGA